MIRQKLREIVFHLLFARGFHPQPQEDQLGLIMRELKVTKKNVHQALESLERIKGHLKTIDDLITQHATSYEFDRIQMAEKTALRLGVYEMLYDDNIPEKVAITEALRICKKFSTKESGKFVHAIMDKILKSR